MEYKKFLEKISNPKKVIKELRITQTFNNNKPKYKSYWKYKLIDTDITYNGEPAYETIMIEHMNAVEHSKIIELLRRKKVKEYNLQDYQIEYVEGRGNIKIIKDNTKV